MSKSKVQEMLEQLEKNPPPTPLRWRRFCMGKTQIQLQGESGVYQARISAFEKGYLSPRPEERKALAKALKIDPDKLIFPTDEQSS